MLNNSFIVENAVMTAVAYRGWLGYLRVCRMG